MSLSPQNFSDKESDNQSDNQAYHHQDVLKVSGLTSAPPSGDPAEQGAAKDSEHFGDLNGHMIGPYLVEARLGGGAMASVYRAVDQVQQREVALKVLLPGADSVVRERFRLEARTVSALTHPNIVATLQVGQTDTQGVTYIAMELIEGISLAELLEQKRQLSVVDSCKLLDPIARALAYAHEKAVIHRDVKPSNILLRRVDPGAERLRISPLDFAVMPLLSDFGIARSLDAPELTSAGRTIGTPAYMAPEQCAGIRQIDGRADIYALGAVLYRCLVGWPPFVGTTTQILHAHVYDPVTIPEEMVKRLPPLVINILRKTLAKEPENRYRNAALLAADLATAARLPEQPIIENEERTATMITIPIVRATPSTSQVLIPAASIKSNVTPIDAGSAVGLRTAYEREKTEREKTGVTPSSRPARKRRAGTNWAGILFGSLLALLPLAIGLVVISTLLPVGGWLTRFWGEPSITPPAVVHLTEMPQAGTATSVPRFTPNPTASVTATLVAQSPPASATAITQTRVITSNVSVPDWWEDAQLVYAQRDWQSTRDKLIVLFRTDETFAQAWTQHRGTEGEIIAQTFFGKTPSPFWQKWRAVIKDPEQVRTILFQTYVGLASTPNAIQKPQDALAAFNSALAIRPNVAAVVRLRDATENYLNATGGAKQQAAATLAQARKSYAQELGDQGDACGASEQWTSGESFAPSTQLDDTLAKYNATCKGVQQATEHTDTLKKFTGDILYSTYEERTYRIYRMPVTNTFNSTLVVMNGAQPRLSPNGQILAFHSTPPDTEGVTGFPLNRGLIPTDHPLRYAPNPEDGRESPADWNPAGDMLIFATRREGDRASRLYLKAASNAPEYSYIFGEDPAWQPNGSAIVYKGTDNTGNQPGLWLVSNVGQSFQGITSDNFQRVTTVGNDRRPAWSPDGKYIVFMSDGRDDNWEIYRLTLSDRTVIRLTTDTAQDGLPTVSPDGKYVAFVSNRGGLWQIWTVGIDGGNPTALGPLRGNLTDWMEHAIQWVK